MKAVLQRTKRASVSVSGITVSEIGDGLCVLIGVHRDDTSADAQYLAEKIAHLRIFSDQNGKFNLSIKDIGGQVLLVSQFTLLANCTRGRRPDFLEAAPPEKAQELYDQVGNFLEEKGIKVSRGVFQAHMVVSLENDGPVTLILDSREKKS
jgi:D-tyrosyl-tRNA(Tyr) deacylase